MDKTSPMKSKPLVDVTCKLGIKGCFEDGRCHALGNCENKIVTNADRIRAMSDEELAELLSQTAYAGETPWCEPFDRKFCDNCPTVGVTIVETGKTMDFNECDFADGKCPHGSDIVWWLGQPAEEGKK